MQIGTDPSDFFAMVLEVEVEPLADFFLDLSSFQF